MRITFTGKTNKQYGMINLCRFRAKNGDIFAVDRTETDWTVNDGQLFMEWRNVYLWELNGDCPFDSEEAAWEFPDEKLAAMLDGAELLEVELEDEADDDYMVCINSWTVLYRGETMAYVLTKTGIRKAKAYITELEAKRKEILDASKDTCEETELPDIETIELDVNSFAENGEYFNCWGVTDNYNSDYPLCLQEGIDYVKEEETV